MFEYAPLVGKLTTRSPTGTVGSVPGPYSITSQQNSCPITMSRSKSTENVPDPASREARIMSRPNLRKCRSDPQMPQARVLTRTSPAPGSGTGMSSTTSSKSRITTARMSSLRFPFPEPKG